MLETLKQSIIIDISIFLNSMIFFLKRMPLIKNLFKDVGYEHSDLSKVLYILGIIHSMVKQLLKSIILLGLAFGVPLLIMVDNIDHFNKSNVYWQLFLLCYILVALPTSKILEPQRRKFISVKLMRMNARRFVIADYFPQLIWREIVELMLFALVANLFSVNMLLALFMVTSKNFFAIFAEALSIKFYHKTGTFIQNKIVLLIIYYIVVISVGFFCTINNYILVIPNLMIFVFGVLLWIIGLLSIKYILTYNNFAAALNDANKLDKLSVDKQTIKNNAAFSTVKLKDKEFSQEELQYDKSSKKEGFSYVNHIFFKRHKRILNGPVKLESIIILALFAIGIGLSFFIPDFNATYVQIIKNTFPAFIFALYFMSTGQKATKAMFYNCDISLLHYGFYKTKEAVLATFTIRAKHLILANLIPAGLLAAAVILIDLITGGSVMTLLPIGIMIIIFSIFFVVHNLFLYYIFQPFTTDLTIKNPFYKFFNFITYMLCYISMQLRNMSITFLIIIVGLTVIYSIVALIVVYRVAPRTFVIK